MTMESIAVCSLKGGVGKTTLSVGLARALMARGYNVGILDLDYRTPNVPLAMDGGVAQLGHSYDGDILIAPNIDNITVFSMAYIWPPHKCVQVEDADAMEDVVHLLQDGIIDWGPDLQYLVIDTPPTSVGVVKVALEVKSLKGALVVTHASSFSRMDTIRTLDLFAEKEVPIIGLVCNQSKRQVGDQWQDLYDLRADDIRTVAEQYGIPFLADIPHDEPQNLMPHFEALAEEMLVGSPVTLKIEQPEEGPWNKLVSLTKKLSGNANS